MDETEELKVGSKRPLSSEDDGKGTTTTHVDNTEGPSSSNDGDIGSSSSSSSSNSRKRRGFSDKPIATTISEETQKHIIGLGLQNPALAAVLSNLANSSTMALPVPSIALPPPVSTGPKEFRELFVGNVVGTGCTDIALKEYLNDAMRKVGLVTGPEDPIISCRMNQKFSFIELRSIEDCNNALNLNGIPFMGQNLKVSRPAKYVGPMVAAKTWQQLTGQDSLPATVATTTELVVDPSTKLYREIFVGNTSPDMTEAHIKDFIGGALMQMGLACSGNENPVLQVRVNQKFSFIEFRTMEEAANSLNFNGIPFMGQQLQLKRPSKFDGTAINYFSWDELYARSLSGELKLSTAGPLSTVICISNMVTAADLRDDELHAEVLEDTSSECAQFGSVVNVTIPRPPSAGTLEADFVNGVGKVFVEMATEEEAKTTLINLKGRKFDGKWVDVKFYPAVAFKSKNYGLPLPNIVVTQMGPVTVNHILGRPVGGGGAQQLNVSALGVTLGTGHSLPLQPPLPGASGGAFAFQYGGMHG